jgi:hypothetical protein
MKNNSPEPQELATGQLWRLKRRYLSIVGLQDFYVRFRLMARPHEPGERVLTADYDTLWRYLISRHGHLVPAA